MTDPRAQRGRDEMGDMLREIFVLPDEQQAPRVMTTRCRHCNEVAQAIRPVGEDERPIWVHVENVHEHAAEA